MAEQESKLTEEIFALTVAIQKLDEAIDEKTKPFTEKIRNIERVMNADAGDLVSQRDVMKTELQELIEKNLPKKKVWVWPKWFEAGAAWRVLSGFSFVMALITAISVMVTGAPDTQASMLSIILLIFVGTYAADSANGICKKGAAQ